MSPCCGTIHGGTTRDITSCRALHSLLLEGSTHTLMVGLRVAFKAATLYIPSGRTAEELAAHDTITRSAGMVLSHGAPKADRVVLTLVPTADEKSFQHVPTTFNILHRSYEWRRSADLSYMLVPRKISSSEILVDLFVNPARKGKVALKEVEAFVQEKIQTEWRGLKLGRIGKVTSAPLPRKAYVRGSIEEILGTNLDL